MQSESRIWTGASISCLGGKRRSALLCLRCNQVLRCFCNCLFTEGFDTAPLRGAKSLLHDLAYDCRPDEQALLELRPENSKGMKSCTHGDRSISRRARVSDKLVRRRKRKGRRPLCPEYAEQALRHFELL